MRLSCGLLVETAVKKTFRKLSSAGHVQFIYLFGVFLSPVCFHLKANPRMVKRHELSNGRRNPTSALILFENDTGKYIILKF